jgi:acetyltransferase-like isoleucine patch superfamily enzyme
LRFPLSVIHGGVSIDRESAISKHSVLFKDVLIFKSSLGGHSYVQEGTSVYYADIGPFCSIAKNVTIGLPMHPMHMISTSPVFYDDTQKLPKFFVKEKIFDQEMLKTIIGPDVWIGQGSLIRAGVRIGVGAVIGAGSVVTKDVPPYTVAAGVPCRPIRRRFDDSLCERLVASGWWDFDEERLVALAPFFSNPAAFVEAVESNA